MTLACHSLRHACDISLFRRNLPIFEQISLFGISEFTYISYTSPYLEFQISLFKINKYLLCLIIHAILKSKSSYLASQMDHMYGLRICIFQSLQHSMTALYLQCQIFTTTLNVFIFIKSFVTVIVHITSESWSLFLSGSNRSTLEPPREKTNNQHTLKQRRRSALQ